MASTSAVVSTKQSGLNSTFLSEEAANLISPPGLCASVAGAVELGPETPSGILEVETLGALHINHAGFTRDATGKVEIAGFGYARDFQSPSPTIQFPVSKLGDSLAGVTQFSRNDSGPVRLSESILATHLPEGVQIQETDKTQSVLGVIPHALSSSPIIFPNHLAMLSENNVLISDYSKGLIIGGFDQGEFTTRQVVSPAEFKSLVGKDDYPLFVRSAYQGQGFSLVAVVGRSNSSSGGDTTHLFLEREGKLQAISSMPGQPMLTYFANGQLMGVSGHDGAQFFKIENEKISKIELPTKISGDAKISVSPDQTVVSVISGIGSGPSNIAVFKIEQGDKFREITNFQFDKLSYPNDCIFESNDTLIFTDSPKPGNLSRPHAVYYHRIKVDLNSAENPARTKELTQNSLEASSVPASNVPHTASALSNVATDVSPLHFFDTAPTSVKCSSDGSLLVVACRDNSVHLLKVDGSGAITAESSLPKNGMSIRSVDLSPDNSRILIHEHDGSILVYSLSGAEPKLDWRLEPDKASSLSFAGFAEDSRFVVAVRDVEFEFGKVELYRVDGQSTAPLASRDIHTDAYVTEGHLSRDRKVLITSENGAHCHGFEIQLGNPDNEGIFSFLSSGPGFKKLWNKEIAVIEKLETSALGDTAIVASAGGFLSSHKLSSKSHRFEEQIGRVFLSEGPDTLSLHPDGKYFVVGYQIEKGVSGLARISSTKTQFGDELVPDLFVTLPVKVTSLRFAPNGQALYVGVESGELYRLTSVRPPSHG